MTKNESFRASEDLMEKVERFVKERKITKSDLYVQALEHFFTCRMTEPSFQLRLIALQYPSICKACKKELEEGAYAMYARGTGAICVECHQKRFGTKGSVRKYMKVVELDYTLKNLTIQCDEKADQLRTFNFYEMLQELFDGNMKLRTLVEKYLLQDLGREEEENETLEEIKNLMVDQIRLTHGIRNFIKIPLRTKKKNKKKEVAY